MLVQTTLVAIAVIACTLHASWLLMPARLRLSAMQRILRKLRKLPDSGVQPTLLQKIALALTRRAQQRADSACGKCSPPQGP